MKFTVEVSWAPENTARKGKPRIDLTGLDHGELVVFEQAEDEVDSKGKHHIMWLCKCKKCGAFTTLRGEYIRKGKHKYCDTCWDNRPDNVARREQLAAELNALAVELGSDMRFTESSLLATYKEIKPLFRH